jgi:hypothetical protein
MLWEVDTAETLVTKAAGMNKAWVVKVVLYPNANTDTITLQNTASEDFIKLKADTSTTAPVEIDFSAENGGKGRPVYGLKCSAISTSATADVYLG